jgi:acyl-CoA synthetase (AMP-forming)/AMP-acid ligase II
MFANMGSFFDWGAQRLLTRAEMQARIEKRRATLAKMGIAAGARVVLPAKNDAEFFISLLALWSLGASAVPLDPRLTETEIQSLKDKARAGHLLESALADAGGSMPLISWPAPDGSETLILFTTGTLSAPRGVVLSARAVAHKMKILGAKLPMADLASALCFLPVSFGHGLITNSLAPWLNGAELTLAPPLDPAGAQELPDLLRERKITFFSSVPGAWALLDRMIEPVEKSGMRRIFCASAPLGENVFRIIQRLFPGVPLHNVYGLTEMCSWISMSAEFGEYVPGEIGFPFDGEMKIENGELSVRGESRMNGYLGEAPLKDGEWFTTRDIADYSESRGYILRGRTGHIVNRGGVKVLLEEIETLLAGNANVREALCFKTEDKDLGENFEAGVVLTDSSANGQAAFLAWFSGQVSPQRRPARWHFIESLPVNARGKPDRAGLKKRIQTLAAMAPSRK